MTIISAMRAVERLLIALGGLGLWFSAMQLVMLPDENRRLLWYAAFIGCAFAGLAVAAARRALVSR